MRRPRIARTAAALTALGLLLTACGGDDEPDAEETTEASEDAADSEEPSASDEESADDGAQEAAGPLTEECAAALTAADTLTVATGDVVFEPWMVDDDPSNGEGFESALVYALAEELGIETVEWVRTGFDEAIAPGSKPYDFNIQQYSITPERDEAVDFSDGYYQVEQALIGAADGDIASATSLDDLADYRLGAALGTTSLDYIDMVIEPTEDAQVFDDNAASKAAFDANQVDGIVYDLPTAYYITAVEIPEASIIGVLPRVGDAPEELGMLFEEGSVLVPCVNDGLAALRDAGTIDALEDEWLNQGGDIPTLTGGES
jgi:polar amino acid transport system substrate-binding protein